MGEDDGVLDAERLGLDRPSYQGPTGLNGVLHDALDRAGNPEISESICWSS